MALPAAVTARANRANELVRAASGVPASTPAALPAAADVASLQQKLNETQAELKKANDALATLQGKYNAELPRAAAELRQAKARAEAAEGRVKELETELKKKIESGDVTSISKEERALLGDGVVQATAKIAREAAESVFTSRIQPLTARVDEFARQSDEAYFVTLDQGCPTWEVVNNDQKFLAWLNAQDPASQRVRFDLLKRAEAARQGHRVVEIFNAYLEGREIGAPKAAPAADPLAARAEPGPGGATVVDVTQTPDGKRLWKRSEIKRFYDEKRAGLWRGREAEAIATENDMFAAQREGRVRDG